MLALKVILVSSAATYVWVVVGAIGSLRISDSVSIGAILSTLAVVAIAGFFTIRANTARIWRENYDAERVQKEKSQEESKDLLKALAEARAEIAALNTRTDLTTHEANEVVRHNQLLESMTALQSALIERTDATTEVLREIAESIRAQQS